MLVFVYFFSSQRVVCINREVKICHSTIAILKFVIRLFYSKLSFAFHTRVQWCIKSGTINSFKNGLNTLWKNHMGFFMDQPVRLASGLLGCDGFRRARAAAPGELPGMGSNDYTPGSVAKLLGTEQPTSVKGTKLQALFSNSAEKSSGIKQKRNILPDVPVKTKKHKKAKLDDDLEARKKRKHETTSRDGHHSDDTVKGSTGNVAKKPKSTMSVPDSTGIPAEEHCSPFVTGSDEVMLNRKALNAKNALTRIESKNTNRTIHNASRECDPARDARTVFIGNVALAVKKKVILRLFRSCGSIEAIRMRSVPVADLKLPRKASVITKQFHPSRNSANAYIVFAAEASVEKAVRLNGTELEGLHIRVNPAVSKPKHDHEKSVFVGNLPFDIEEELIRKHFVVCGNITNVRVIRDPKTGAGKGFGYITFEDASSVTLALSLNNQSLSGRQLRVQRSTERAKPSQKPIVKQRSLKRDNGRSPKKTPVPSTKPGITHKAPERKKKSDRRKVPILQDAVKSRTTVNHKKVKEHRKKQLRRRAEMKRKTSLGQLLMKNKSGDRAA